MTVFSLALRRIIAQRMTLLLFLVVPLGAIVIPSPRTVAGILLLILMVCPALNALEMVTDRAGRREERVALTPGGPWHYWFWYSCALAAVTVALAVISSVVIGAAFRLAPGATVLLGAVASLFAITAVAFAGAVARMVRNAPQGAVAFTFLILPQVLIGANFWLLEDMAPVLQRAGPLVPTWWAMVAITEILAAAPLTGGPLATAPLAAAPFVAAPPLIAPLAALVLFAAVWGLMGAPAPPSREAPEDRLFSRGVRTAVYGITVVRVVQAGSGALVFLLWVVVDLAFTRHGFFGKHARAAARGAAARGVAAHTRAAARGAAGGVESARGAANVKTPGVAAAALTAATVLALGTHPAGRVILPLALTTILTGNRRHATELAGLRARESLHHHAGSPTSAPDHPHLPESHTARELVQLAELRERDRISHALHDTAGHRLTGILMQLQAVERLYHAGDTATVPDRLARCIEEMRTVVELIRDTVHDLKPRSTSAGERLTQAARAFTACPVEVYLDPAVDSVPPDISGELVRAAEEALTNVARHTSATAVRITVQRSGEQIHLTVADNGAARQSAGTRTPGPSGQPAGTHPPAPASDSGDHPPREGLGLRGIRSRAERMGGTLHITRQAGFTLHLSLPLPPEDAS